MTTARDDQPRSGPTFKGIFRVKMIPVYVLSFILIAGLATAARAAAKRLPVGESQRLLAERGIARNADWQPVIRTRHGLDMALVPAGCFLMGATNDQLREAKDACDRYYGVYGCQQTFEHEQPAHQVCLSRPYWLGRTPVTNRQYGSSSNLGGDSPRRGSNWPRETVTWDQAAEFCRQRGARLPTEAEWEFAARGPDGLIYPWGNAYDIEKATLRKISPPPVGEKPAGASWVGALDMSGGVGEWVADWYGPYAVEDDTDPAGPSSGELRILRGGDWFAHASHFVRTTYRDPRDPGYATYTVGFRCAADYPP